MTLLRFVTLSSNLDIEANKFYARAHQLYNAALHKKCYTQYALRPHIDSEMNHIRHFIKIQFVNQGIAFTNLPSIFKNKFDLFLFLLISKIRNHLLFVISTINQRVALYWTLTN